MVPSKSSLRNSRPVLTMVAASLLAGLVLQSGGAHAAKIEGVEFPNEAILGEERAPLQGIGLLRYKLFIKAYVAAFYAAGRDSPDPLARSPRRLEIEYFWSLKAQQFASATQAGMEANLSRDEIRVIAPEIAQMNALYEDVEPGDRYALTYVEGRTELAKNGRTLGSVEGEDFGRAMFAIWLGRAPLSPSLKSQLLGKADL